MTNNEFVHLRLHTEYSITDGLLRIDDLVKTAKHFKMSAIAVTDHSNLFAMVKFYKKAIANGIKPIIGADLILRDQQENFPLTLLCLNATGYQNLTCLISKAYVEGQYESGKPTILWSWLKEAHEGLLVLSGGVQGDIGQALLNDREELAKDRLTQYLSVFSGRFYLELQRTERPQEEMYIAKVLKLAHTFQCPVVATNDVRFLSREDFEAHEARVCIHQGYVLEDSKRPRIYSEAQYFRSQEEMQILFADIPEALQNTVAISQRCTLSLALGEVHLPQFPGPNGLTPEQYFEQQSINGLEEKFKDLVLTTEKKAEYLARLRLEMDVIQQMGFASYFLIVADFIQWAKQQGIPVGPGRGSGAGSLVAYVLKITSLDPLEHELLFERFLNPERVSMPDFDVDFCMEKRDQVIDYVAERYGREAVSQIITYGTMAAKAVVRDVGRVLGYPYGLCDQLAKLIPFELGITLEKALLQEPELQKRYDSQEEVKVLIDLALKLEGITRNAGKHAGGVIIAPGKLTDFAPLYCEMGGANLVTQFDKDDVEAVGLVKFDFLGLRTLTIIDWAVQAINQLRAKDQLPLIDIEKIPLDDKKTFDLLKSCATTAVFQLESRGMKDLIRRLQPDSFEEITALVALFRPGPLQSGMVDDFIDRKHGRSAVNYPHPDLKPVLQPTYGVILYQEQVMQIARVLAGYTLGGADILRRAMGKKKPEEMALQRQVFVDGASLRHIDAKTSEAVFDLVEKFAGYGFNKSHSAAYALIAYQTAWLKAHFAEEFMAAVLSSDMDNTDKIVSFVEECRHRKLDILPPNVNQGFYHFTVNLDRKIVYGIGAIKGVGEAAVLHIVHERETHGPYTHLFEFCQRVDLHKVNRRVLEALVRSGAMDSWSVPRTNLLASIDKAIQAAEQYRKNQAMGQSDLFADVEEIGVSSTPEYEIGEKISLSKILEDEKNTLGYYLSGHPIEAYQQSLNTISTTKIAALARATKKNVLIAGLLLQIRNIVTKGGRRLCILKLEDETGAIEITVFSKLYDESRDQLKLNQVLVVRGKIEDDKFSGGVRIVAEEMTSLEAVCQKNIKALQLKWDQVRGELNTEQLMTILKPFVGGNCAVTIAYTSQAAGTVLQLGKAWQVHATPALLDQLYGVFGRDEVFVKF